MIVRRILLINVILLGVIALLAYELYSGWQDYDNSRPLERIVTSVSGQAEENGLPDYRELGNSRLQSDFIVSRKMTSFILTGALRKPVMQKEREELMPLSSQRIRRCRA